MVNNYLATMFQHMMAGRQSPYGSQVRPPMYLSGGPFAFPQWGSPPARNPKNFLLPQNRAPVKNLNPLPPQRFQRMPPQGFNTF